MSNVLTHPEQFVFAQDQELKTTSLKVAEAFGKDHSNVIKVLERTLAQVPDSFEEVNFDASEYVRNNNLGFPVKYKMYVITKDGFMLLVMGFTGKKAMAIKIAYINAFNLMHEKLMTQQKLLAPFQREYKRYGVCLNYNHQSNLDRIAHVLRWAKTSENMRLYDDLMELVVSLEYINHKTIDSFDMLGKVQFQLNSWVER